MRMRESEGLSNAVAEALDKLVRMASDAKQPSFRSLVETAGLDPARDFVGASLRDLDFRDEDLREFNFSDADLTGADFRRANVDGVAFTGAELTGAIGLTQDEFPRDDSQVQRMELKIVNRRGLHARPASRFVQTVERFDADVRVSRGNETVGGTSIMGLMILSAGPGTSITVTASGKDRNEVLKALEELINGRFGQDD